MNKKSIFKMALMMLIGAIFGGGFTIAILFLNDNGSFLFYEDVKTFFLEYNTYIYIALFVLMYLPSGILHLKGKKDYLELVALEDDDYSDKADEKEKKLNYSLLLNALFLIFNFMLMGVTHIRGEQITIPTILFLVNVILASSLEMMTIRFLQKNDPRLKGDPTSFKFNKDYVESLDEAEKLKVYKSGYKAYTFSRTFVFVLMILSILLNITLETGGFPVIICGVIIISQITSYYYHAMKKNENKI